MLRSLFQEWLSESYDEASVREPQGGALDTGIVVKRLCDEKRVWDPVVGYGTTRVQGDLIAGCAGQVVGGRCLSRGIILPP